MKIRLMLCLTAAAFLFMFTDPSSHADNPGLSADLIIQNTMVRSIDGAHPTAEAVAVRGHRIVAVGSTKEIKKLAGKNTRVIDAKGQLVLPGFNDAHVHFMGGGFQLANVDLRDADSPQEFAERIRRFAEKLPTKELIDRFTPETPVFVNRLDGHMALANSAALKLAGVTRQTLDPPGGIIGNYVLDAFEAFATRRVARKQPGVERSENPIVTEPLPVGSGLRKQVEHSTHRLPAMAPYRSGSFQGQIQILTCPGLLLCSSDDSLILDASST